MERMNAEMKEIEENERKKQLEQAEREKLALKEREARLKEENLRVQQQLEEQRKR